MAITSGILGATAMSGNTSTNQKSLHALQSVPSSTLLAPTPALRRLLTVLPKSSLCSLVSRWLSFLSSSGRSTDGNITPPSFSRRNAGASTGTSTSTYLDLHESRRARNVEELRALWKGPMLDARVPKGRAVDRILETDWPEGISYAMVSMVAAEALEVGPTSRTWTAARAFFEEGDESEWLKGAEETQRGTCIVVVRLSYSFILALLFLAPPALRSISAEALRARLTSELRNYFTHHLYLLKAQGQSGSCIASPFIHLHLTLPPHAPDVCGGTHILYVPGTRWVLLSGSLGRAGGGDSRSILHAALAQALGALEVRGPKSGIAGRPSTKGAAEDDDEERRREQSLPELKGKDPKALLDVLLAGESAATGHGRAGSGAASRNTGTSSVAEGGAGRAMRHGHAEDEPLLGIHKRKRLLDDPVLSTTLREESNQIDADAAKTEHPAVRAARVSLESRVQLDRQKEIRELFGERRGKGDSDIPSIERIDYELHLPTPAAGPYRPVSLNGPGEEAVRLRIQGSHILAGLRALVQSGADERSVRSEDRNTAGDGISALHERKGLPTWLTDVRGTRVVVRPVKKALEEDESVDI